MGVQILFQEIELFSISSNRSDSSNRSKRKTPLKFDNEFPYSIQMVKPLLISKSKRKKLRLMEMKKPISNSELICDGVCDSICENDDGLVVGSSPPAIDVEKSTSLTNKSSPILNASVSPVVSVAVLPVALANSQPCIPLQTYNLRPRGKYYSR